MKYIDYAAMGAAFSASQRASEAFDEIDRLQNQIDAMRASAWDAREEFEFQKWIEELIYQFGKVTSRVESQPGDPVADFQEIASYLKMIKEKQINTRVISGLENKKVFEDVLARAEKLFDDLWKHPAVVEQRKLLAKQVEEEKKREEAQEEQRLNGLRKNAEQNAHWLKKRRYFMGIVAGMLGLGTVGTYVFATAGQELSPFFGTCLLIWLVIWAWVDGAWQQE